MKSQHRLFLIVALSASMALSPSAQGTAPATVAPYDVVSTFAASGWMGDFKGLRTETSTDAPPGARGSRRWIWTPAKAGAGWVAVAFQYPDKNWGDRPGRDLSGKGYQELSVWARGVADKAGRLPRIQFKSGGGTDPAKKHQASFEAEGEPVELSTEWRRYTVPLGKDLSQVISAFTFVMQAEANSLGADVFLARIELR